MGFCHQAGLRTRRASQHTVVCLCGFGCRYLVVDDDMNGASDCVVRQSTHIQGLVHHTLSSKGAITVHENAHVLGPLTVL